MSTRENKFRSYHIRENKFRSYHIKRELYISCNWRAEFSPSIQSFNCVFLIERVLAATTTLSI